MAERRIDALPLAACVVAGAIPASIVAGLIGGGVRMGIVVLPFALAFAALIGAPLALWRLRDPALPWWRWIGTGAAGGVIVTLLVLGWVALSDARALAQGQWGGVVLLVAAHAVPLGTLSAACSRLALLAWLRR
jgi:hypothetical protein